MSEPLTQAAAPATKPEDAILCVTTDGTIKRISDVLGEMGNANIKIIQTATTISLISFSHHLDYIFKTNAEQFERQLQFAGVWESGRERHAGCIWCSKWWFKTKDEARVAGETLLYHIRHVMPKNAQPAVAAPTQA